MTFPVSHVFFPPQTVTGQKLFCVLFWVGIFCFFKETIYMLDKENSVNKEESTNCINQENTL